jgi:hypothetical protein
VAVSPNGVRLFVGGTSYGEATHSDYVTIAYDSSRRIEGWSRAIGSMNRAGRP